MAHLAPAAPPGRRNVDQVDAPCEPRLIAIAILFRIRRTRSCASSRRDAAVSGLAANRPAEHSPARYGLGAALVSEIILTFIFMTVILEATSKRAVAGFAGIPIGLTIRLGHLVGIPITNLSVNPARSTGPAIFVGGWALEQRWLFWVAPIVGASIAGAVGGWLHEGEDVPAKTRDQQPSPLQATIRA